MAVICSNLFKRNNPKVKNLVENTCCSFILTTKNVAYLNEMLYNQLDLE